MPIDKTCEVQRDNDNEKEDPSNLETHKHSEGILFSHDSRNEVMSDLVGSLVVRP